MVESFCDMNRIVPRRLKPWPRASSKHGRTRFGAAAQATAEPRSRSESLPGPGLNRLQLAGGHMRKGACDIEL